MVRNIVDAYAADVATATAIRGSRLDFDELKQKIVMLEKALTEKGASVIDAYKKQTGEDAAPLVDDFKLVITTSIQDFIKTL